jgi:hypothetical protein
MDTIQESRTERITASATPTEKRAVELFAAVEGRTVSELIRAYTLDDMIARGQEIAGRLKRKVG